ncbi:hypothetical protein HHI36_021929 [Cryptolaemus montrouzieri]|uniref:Mitochondrial ribosomal protein L1 n=1 Tax=Cryptolaemus montrouzieri TaxID=559131 RepID=A0ABD2MY69_9CUCU
MSFTQRFSLISLSSPLLKAWREPTQIILSRNYAARKGTRERKSKKKVKVEVEKVGFIPHALRSRDKLLASKASRKFDDSWKQTPVDVVYSMRYYRSKVYPFLEAVNCHRETHHPEVYNQPNAPLQAIFELNMQGEKKTRFVENFNRICGIQHPFDHGEERTIIAFAKDGDAQKSASEAGAQLAGGVELIKNIQNGKVSLQDFQFVIAHPDILHELSSLRGILKKKFPNPKAGTLDIHLDEVVYRYLHGINYTAKKDEFEKDFGVIETTIGTLNMDASHLEANFAALIEDVMIMKPKREGSFLMRTLLVSPPSRERFTIDYTSYLKDVNKQEKESEAQQSDELDQRAVIEN